MFIMRAEHTLESNRKVVDTHTGRALGRWFVTSEIPQEYPKQKQHQAEHGTLNEEPLCPLNALLASPAGALSRGLG
jgi:hypothetical protein